MIQLELHCRLFFHNLPWSHVLKSGKTILKHIEDSHAAGVDGARKLQRVWTGLAGIDMELHTAVKERFDLQIADAQFFSTVLLDYYHKVASKQGGRPIGWE